MDNDQFLNLLKSSKLFSSFDVDTLLDMKKISIFEDYPKDSLVVNQGDYGDKFYFVLEGSLEVYLIDKSGEQKVINVLNPGDYFGELALLVDSIRSASVKTRSVCKLFWLDKTTFDRFLSSHPNVCRELLTIISSRLAQALHILSKKGIIIFVQMNYTEESQECVMEFEKYFKKISPLQVILTNVSDFNDALARYDTNHTNYYFLIKNNIQLGLKLPRKPNYVINFTAENSGNYNLPPGSSQWLIENTVRRVTKKTIGIALASGGAPGMAHIGVLNEFKKEKIPIDFIVGTSAGALYGSVYAFGYDFETLLEMIMVEIRRPKLLTIATNFCFNFSGLMRNAHLKKLFYPIFGELNFEDALIPLATVASDLHTGKTIVIKTGKVIDGLTASNSAPLIIEPYGYNNHLLIDGVATAPLPIKALYDEKIDIKIAVPIPQLDLVVSMKRRPKMPSIYLRSRSMMAHEITNFSSKMADVIVRPQVEGSRLIDWANMQKYIDAGADAAKKSIKRLQQYLKSPVF